MRSYRGPVQALSVLVVLTALLPQSAIAIGVLPADEPDAALINRGRDLFLHETFSGNGRTCGSCHPEQNNLTLDPEFISSLPADDPLFIAEREGDNPLAAHFERPALMHSTALIVENTNGFDDVVNNFTLRSVPHLLALRTSLTPPSANANDGTSTPPDQRTGWSGDGAPTDLSATPPRRGTLRDFSTGAVIQHFTRSLARQPGVDFRLPSADELDALEAYMLAQGRQQEFDDLHGIRLHDARADAGRRVYLGEGLANGVPCNACHFNGGANTDPNFAFPPGITPPAFEHSNRSFAPRVEELKDQAGDLVAGEMPFDDGFGHGTSLFNVPTVIEAADTGPFFHANQIDTVEGLVSFYSSQRHLRDGTVLAPIVGLNGSQVVNVAAFMRVVNADENARSAIQLLDYVTRLYKRRDKAVDRRLAIAEINDALEVLQGGHLHFADAVPLLKKARKAVRKHHEESAMRLLQKVRETLIQRDS